MPSPLEVFWNPVSLTCIGIYAALMLWEKLLPARKLPVVPYWQLRGLIAFVSYFLVASYLPLWWDATLAEYRLLDTTGLPLWGQALAGLLVYEFGVYWWHRTMHATPWLWRSFHQFHHSAERLDTYGAFWFSPWDMVGWTLINSFALVLVLGISVEAAILVLYTTFFLGVFQHANIRTPRWLGYIVQRPESHSRHHARGVHRDNYADLPLLDLLFGTFNNPAIHLETGLYHGASGKVLDMLLWKDLSARQNAAAQGELRVTE